MQWVSRRFLRETWLHKEEFKMDYSNPRLPIWKTALIFGVIIIVLLGCVLGIRSLVKHEEDKYMTPEANNYITDSSAMNAERI
jgi:hypothetical protein